MYPRWISGTGIRPSIYEFNWNSWQAKNLVLWLPLDSTVNYHQVGDGVDIVFPGVSVAAGITPKGDAHFGLAPRLDGSSTIEFTSETISATQDLTWSVWAMTEDLITSNNRRLWSHGTFTNTLSYVGGTPGSFLYIDDSGGFGSSFSFEPVAFQPFHIVIAKLGSNSTPQAWVNGVEYTVTSARTPQGGTGILYVGSNTGTNRFWLGHIYEIRRYNRYFTDMEAKLLFNPRTRWELYMSPTRRSWMEVVAPVGGRIWKLAGEGGGLAGRSAGLIG